jgi:peptidoglycan/LPS O-acetylase OafA/YrhL
MIGHSPSARRPDRLGQLDGLRGVAALVVVAHHYFLAFAPAMQPIRATRPHWLFDTPLALAYNGGFAVAIFFVVSGFVVANAGAARKSPLWLTLVARYLRLAVPAVISVLFAWAMLNAFKGAGRALVGVQPHNWLYLTYLDGTPGVLDAMWNGLVGAFWTGSSRYNNPLWTMRIELVGSVIVYAVYAFVPARWRALIAAAAGGLAILIHQQDYLPFALGALLREAWANKMLPARAALPALLVGVVLGAPLQRAELRFGVEHWAFFDELGKSLGLPAILAAALMVTAVLSGPRIGAALRTRMPSFLGRISFLLFLVHIPLIFSIGATLFVRAWPVDAVEMGLGFVGLAVLAVAIAFAATKFIDEPFVRWLSARRRAFATPRRRGTQGPA